MLSLSPKRGAQKRKVTIFRIEVYLSCKRSMLLVFWQRQRFYAEYCLTHAIAHHRPKTDPPCSAVSAEQLVYFTIMITHRLLTPKTLSAMLTDVTNIFCKFCSNLSAKFGDIALLTVWTLCPFNVFILLSGWICLYSVLD